MSYMSASPIYTVDSNIFLYALDVRDPVKHGIALRVMTSLVRQQGSIPLQCLSESYAVCAKKPIVALSKARMSIMAAQTSLNIIPAAAIDISIAIDLHDKHRLQFFDALLLATASRTGCNILLSEDMQDGQSFGSITVRNPFAMNTAELNALIG